MAKTKERLSYTALGDQVNVASRLEGKNAPFGTEVIISEETASKVKDRFVLRFLGLTNVKGKNASIKIFEPVGYFENVSQDTLASVSLFNLAMENMLDQKWLEAFALFKEYSEKYTAGPVEQPIIETCLSEIELQLRNIKEEHRLIAV